jgi:hypothetical protein
MTINRRDFIKNSSFVLGGAMASTTASAMSGLSALDNKPLRVSHLNKPVAIAMWDFSWILRHHRYGSFENWDQVLEGLAERGYDSIRMDCMPQFVAADSDGKLQKEFRAVRNNWGLAMWGNDVTMSFNPRQALLEFLPKCKKYGIKVGLSSWFMRHGTSRTEIFKEEGGLLRAWKETLTFLDKHGLLDDNIMYVDLLNEYPDWHGYDWLKQEINKRSDVKQFKLDNPNANMPDLAANPGKHNNPLQKKFYNDFLNNLLKEIRKAYPQCDYFASISSSYGHVDVNHFDAIDRHIWFENHHSIPGLGVMHAGKVNVDLRELHSNLRKYWDENRKTETEWMDKQITAVANDARKNNIVCGNTEGWGAVGWFDHPEVDWRFIKESAEICVDLCLKHDNYKFICTSNFTHPHFKGYWEDIKWHQQITSKIKNRKS